MMKYNNVFECNLVQLSMHAYINIFYILAQQYAWQVTRVFFTYACGTNMIECIYVCAFFHSWLAWLQH